MERQCILVRVSARGGRGGGVEGRVEGRGGWKGDGEENSRMKGWKEE